MKPKALLIKYPGTNCDLETSLALSTVGFEVETLPIFHLSRKILKSFQLIVLSGGFSHGDYIIAGKLAALETQQKIGEEFHQFTEKGAYILGICNGFQILTHLNLLPQGSLSKNTSGHFLCRWVRLKKTKDCFYLSHLPDEFELPIAHSEGRFVVDEKLADQYLKTGLAPLIYTEDVNGSVQGIAGLQSKNGRVFGLMPHPERFLFRDRHPNPDWNGDSKWGWGYFFFRSIFKKLS